MAYRPYEPLLTLKVVAEDIWTVDGPEIWFRYGILRFPFPTRMTVVRLPGGGIWLHSPIEPSQAIVEEILRLGPVRCLVAPNSLHYWWVAAWKARFPEAEVWAAPNMSPKAGDRLPLHEVLGSSPPPVWEGSIDQVLVSGTVITEIEFFHRRSKSLIITDLIENFEADRFTSVPYRALARLGGTVDPDGSAPRDLRWTFRKVHPELVTAVDQMIAWNPRQLVLAHGRCYSENVTAELRRAFKWVR